MKPPNKPHIWRIAGLFGVDGLLFCLTDAGAVPSFMVIIGFGLLSLTIYYLIYGVIGLGHVYGLPVRRRKPLAVYLTAILSGLIALQSVGQLGGRDIMVLAPLAAVAYFYSAYAKRPNV